MVASIELAQGMAMDAGWSLRRIMYDLLAGELPGLGVFIRRKIQKIGRQQKLVKLVETQKKEG